MCWSFGQKRWACRSCKDGLFCEYVHGRAVPTFLLLDLANCENVGIHLVAWAISGVAKNKFDY